MAAYDITPLDNALEFDTTQATVKSITKLSDTRFVLAWFLSSTARQVQAFDVNTSTGAITALSSPLSFYTFNYTTQDIIKVVSLDSTHIVICWQADANTVLVRTYNVNAGTGAITTWGNQYILDSSTSIMKPDIYAIDSSHVLVVYEDNSFSDGFSIVLSVDGSGNLNGVGSPFEFDTSQGRYPVITRLGSSNKFLVSYSGMSDDGYAVILDVNLSTWAISNANSSFEYLDNVTLSTSWSVVLPGSPTIAIIDYKTDSTRAFRPLSINDSTFALSTLGSVTTPSSSSIFNNDNYQNIVVIDDTHFLCFMTDVAADGYVRSYSIDKSTGVITQLYEVEFDILNGTRNTALFLSSDIYINAWTGDANDGFVRAFRIGASTPSTSNSKSLLLLGVG